MSSINTPIINLINEHLSQYITYIKELENIIESLNKKLEQNISIEKYNKLHQKLDNLTDRHIEIKQVYTEIEQENIMLRKENDELKIKQESLVMDVKELFNKSSFYPQTPLKTNLYNSNVLPPNQKIKYCNYKNSLNPNSNTKRVLNFDQVQQEQTSNLMLLDKGLMTELEKSINEYSHQQTYANNNKNCKANIQSKKPCIHSYYHNIQDEDVYMNLNYVV